MVSAFFLFENSSKRLAKLSEYNFTPSQHTYTSHTPYIFLLRLKNSGVYNKSLRPISLPLCYKHTFSYCWWSRSPGNGSNWEPHSSHAQHSFWWSTPTCCCRGRGSHIPAKVLTYLFWKDFWCVFHPNKIDVLMSFFQEILPSFVIWRKLPNLHEYINNHCRSLSKFPTQKSDKISKSMYLLHSRDRSVTKCPRWTTKFPTFPKIHAKRRWLQNIHMYTIPCQALARSPR